MNAPHIFDMAIVGGGPVGLFGAYYAGLRNMTCIIIESLPVLGGRLVSVFPEKHVYDVPGFPKILARDLARNLVEQALQFGATAALEEAVVGLKRQEVGGYWELDTTVAPRLARTVLLAGGIGQFSPQKHTAPGAAEFEGKGLAYAVLDKAIYAGKKVVVAGGGDSAVDWATELLVCGATSVTLVHRTARFRAHERSLTRFRDLGGTVITDTEIVEFGGGSELGWVALRHKPTGETNRLCVDSALVMFGFRSELPDFSLWGMKISGENGEVEVNSRMETGLQGVYAAGDVVQYDSKLRLMATGFSEAAMAVNLARRFLVPTEEVQPLHSTQIMEGR